MFVELDIFSGRVNPRWELDASQEERLRALQQGLPQGPDPAPEPPGLGYRGLRYVLDGVPYRVWNGTVAGPGWALVDRDRMIERALLELVPAEYGDVRERIARELDH